MNYNLTDLSPGERFWIERNRCKEKQVDVAVRLRIAERRYNHIERGLRQPDKGLKVPKVKPTEAELFALARRRDGRSLRALVAVLGAGSHMTLLAWEASANPKLRGAWEGLGFRF